MRLTRRGKVVLAVVLALAMFGLYQLVNHIWWVGNGWCWGTAQKCLGL